LQESIMLISMDDFEEKFEIITGHKPYRWQEKVYGEMLRDSFDNLKLPTGTGKTSVMVIWLLALAKRAERSQVYGFPRRLVWVVDRRTVVDQATALAETIKIKLEDSRLTSLKSTLSSISATEGALAVSTLRGELADNGEWKKDPSKPAIVVATVDMAGSKLLFSGYGDGRWHRSLHAGLLGTDVLFVLDEAHLSIPFAQLLKRIAELGKNEEVALPPFRFMFLSATLDEDSKVSSMLKEEDNGYLLKVLGAHKKLILHEQDERKGSLPTVLAELAWETGREKDGSRIVIYATSPKDVLIIRNILEKKGAAVVALTGTIRGYERDQLVEHPVFKTFLSKQNSGKKTVYLVANSAGEVGIDMYADHMICNLVSADRMVQRLGRVNRSGDGDAVVHVVKGYTKTTHMALERTWEYLEKVSQDASPMGLLRSPPPKDALEPRPHYPPLQNWIVDSWSLTTIDDWSSRPEVEAWLKGLEDSQPDVYFAWRDDVDDMVRLEREEITDVIRKYPILSRERLRESETDAKEKIAKLAERVPKGKAILLSYLGNIIWKGELQDLMRQIDQKRLGYTTLLVSTSCGGLREGFFDPECANAAEDVGHKQGERFKAKLELIGDRFSWSFYSQTIHQLTGGDFDNKSEAVRHAKRQTGLEPYLIKLPDEEKDLWLAYFVKNVYEGHTIPATSMKLLDHQEKAEKWARSIGEKLGLQSDYINDLAEAARNHDAGKDSTVWQAYAKNNDPEPLAKSGEYDDPGSLRGYRHELGSVLRYKRTNDLVLHLIASHHGHARPTYPERAADPERPVESTKEMQRAPLRFALLQKKLGWWGLAYLESIIKAADVLASEVNGAA